MQPQHIYPTNFFEPDIEYIEKYLTPCTSGDKWIFSHTTLGYSAIKQGTRKVIQAETKEDLVINILSEYNLIKVIKQLFKNK